MEWTDNYQKPAGVNVDGIETVENKLWVQSLDEIHHVVPSSALEQFKTQETVIKSHLWENYL